MTRVLVVDDSPDVREAIEAVLEFSDIGVEPAANGQEALVKLRMHEVDLVLLDLVMPGLMDGFDVRDEMLRDPELAAVPCVVISNLPLNREGMDRLRPSAVLPKKHMSLDRLLSVVRGLIGRKDHHDMPTRAERRQLAR